MTIDKYLHFGASFVLTLALSTVLPFGYAAAAVLLIGMLKELYDYRHPLMHTADWKDFAADLGGVVAAVSIVLLT